MRGQITRVIAGFYDIISDGKDFRVRGSGKLRNENMSPVVGDYVEFDPDAFVESIYPRENELVRPKVANVDQVVIITSLKEPNYSSILLNKLLAVIEYNQIKPILVFTKKDLTDDQPYLEYENMGYEVYVIDNNDTNSVTVMNDIFKDKLTVFTGQTGAGKSTTISNLAHVELETQEISRALGRGKHTTRVVEIISWKNGRLIDTPGFSSYEPNLSKNQLSKSYFIFQKYSEDCKFKNCLHFKEEVCGVKSALNDNKISESRYNDYIRLIKEASNE